MSELRTVALELVEEARALVEEIDEFQSPPSRSKIDVVQDRMNRLQRLLNRMQTETDARSEEKERSSMLLVLIAPPQPWLNTCGTLERSGTKFEATDSPPRFAPQICARLRAYQAPYSTTLGVESSGAAGGEPSRDRLSG